MKIEKTVDGNHALLKMIGEFDTFHVAKLSEAVESLLAQKISHAVLNMRMVEFMNSTALGSLIKAQKRLREKGGDLVISRPSVFCKELLVRVGLDRLIKVFPTDEAAGDYLRGLYSNRTDASTVSSKPGKEPDLEDESSVLIAFADPVKGDAIGGHAVGRLAQITETEIELNWQGGRTGLKGDKLVRLVSPGTELRLKFRIPLFKKGFFELPTTVTQASAQEEGGVKIRSKFGEMTPTDKKAIQQFVQDVDYLKSELKKATKK